MVGDRIAAGLIAAGMAFAVPVLAHAETAEEAVAYAFMGLADGATFERATTTLSWTEASASPAVFDGDASIGGQPATVQFTVTATDPCHFEITLQGPMVPGGGKALYARVDLTAVDGLTPGADSLHIAVAGDGFCETGRTNTRCMVMNRSELFGFVEAERHAELTAFLREEVCPKE